jgi:serine/threonine protein kinase
LLYFPHREYDEKADMYSVGVIVCEIATGVLPSVAMGPDEATPAWRELSDQLRQLIKSLLAEVCLFFFIFPYTPSFSSSALCFSF